MDMLLSCECVLHMSSVSVLHACGDEHHLHIPTTPRLPTESSAAHARLYHDTFTPKDTPGQIVQIMSFCVFVFLDFTSDY